MCAAYTEKLKCFSFNFFPSYFSVKFILFSFSGKKEENDYLRNVIFYLTNLIFVVSIN